MEKDEERIEDLEHEVKYNRDRIEKNTREIRRNRMRIWLTNHAMLRTQDAYIVAGTVLAFALIGAFLLWYALR